ncbi:hypothetical protein FXO38_23810 [Capsicum annuum]|nr:cyclin-D5-3-like [Capsicum annuum]KAF3637234.1 hypothetical protein FXO38_23810 [Capsicum annuum]
MEEDWGDIFRSIQNFVSPEQEIAEEIRDIGADNEDYVNRMLGRENRIAIAGLTSCLPSRIMHHGWLLQVRNTAIDNIVTIGGPFGVRQITIYAAVTYVDRFLSVMPIKNERFRIPVLLGMACLNLASEVLERYEHQVDLSEYEKFADYDETTIMDMTDHVIHQFGETVTCVTPIQFTKYFLSRFCRDNTRTEYARIKTVHVIMSTLGDVRLMSLRPFIVGLAATLLASNPNILNEGQIATEISALPPNWLIPLDEVCSCYNRLLETNRERLDIS